jgi:hypothetical protein
MQYPVSLITALAGLALSIVVSCYPSENGPGSSNKSLDNFANGGVSRYNSCTPNTQSLAAAKDTQVSAPSQQSQDTLFSALSAVPAPFLKAFQAAGGRVVVSRDAAKICGAISQDNSEKDLNTGAMIPSCWIQEKANVAPQIFLSDDPVLIRHSTIRAFTYFFTEYFLTRINRPDVLSKIPQGHLWPAGIQEFENQRDAVSQAFLRDLDSKRSDLASGFRKAAALDPLKFKNAVLAEVLDSCYCSEKTRATFREQFPATWSASQCRTQ